VRARPSGTGFLFFLPPLTLSRLRRRAVTASVTHHARPLLCRGGQEGLHSPAPHRTARGGGERETRPSLLPQERRARRKKALDGVGSTSAGLRACRADVFLAVFPRPSTRPRASWRFAGHHSATASTLAGRHGRQRLVKDFPLLPRGILPRLTT
jgi:hypothetical protein